MDNIIKFPNAEQRLAREMLKKYETPESRTLRTHRNIFTFGDRYGVPIDSLDSPYTTPTKEMLDEKSNKLFTEKADE